jgi:TonB family protein
MVAPQPRWRWLGASAAVAVAAAAVAAACEAPRPTSPNEVVLMESMGSEQPVLLSASPQQYPNLLRQAGIQGRVTVRAFIDSTGRADPASVQVIDSPHPGFDQAARTVVLQARFRDGRSRGRAVRVVIEFQLDPRAGG